MGKLTDAARQAGTSRQRFTTYSDAQILAGTIMAGLVGAFLLYQMVFGTTTLAPGAQVDPSTGQVTLAPPAPPPGPAVPTAAPTQPEPTEPAGRQVTMPAVDGSTVEVPEQAVDLARAGVAALFTGAFDDIALDGTPPPGTQTWPNPQVTGGTVVTAVEDYLVVRFDVDPDGPGPQTARAITGAVRHDGTAWRFAV